MNKKNFTLPNLKVLPYGGAKNIPDANCSQVLETAMTTAYTDLNSKDINQQYLDNYQSWIRQTELNSLVGLDNFKHAVYSQGTTETFDKFYMKHHTRRFRCFRGEYMYHQLAWRNHWPNWEFIQNLDIEAGDAVVISMPFADTGDVHPEYHALMEKCQQLNVPVLIDSAYFGICGGLTLDYSYDCITDIAFSLSKTFPVSHIRIGMRLSRVDDDDPLLVYHKTNYTNRIGASVGLELMRQFSSDYTVNTYRTTQQELCRQLDVDPSPCVIFGVDYRSVWPQYNRGAGSSRLCIADNLVSNTVDLS